MAKINLCRKNKRTFWGCRPKVRRGYRTMWAVSGNKNPIIYPPQIVAFYDACYGDGTDLRVGSEFVWSYADRDTPLIDNGAIVCDVAFTNELPSTSLDYTNWGQVGCSVNENNAIVTQSSPSYITATQCTIIDDTQYVGFVDISAGSKDWVRLSLSNAKFPPDANEVYINVSTGVIGTIESGVFADVLPLGDGVFRCIIGATSSTGGITAPLVVVPCDADGSIDITPDGSEAVYLHHKEQLTEGPYIHNYIPPGTSQASTAGSSGGNGAAISMVEYVDGVAQPKAIAIKEALESPCTLLTRATMGVGSDEIPSGFRNILTVDDTAFSVQQYGTGDSIVDANDGTKAATITATPWSRNDDIIRLTEVSTGGTQFRVGYINATTTPEYSIDDVTWSALVSFDGSFDPLDHLRFAFETTVPISISQVILSNLGGDAETLLELSKKWRCL